jgi:hypothetical protein
MRQPVRSANLRLGNGCLSKMDNHLSAFCLSDHLYIIEKTAFKLLFATISIFRPDDIRIRSSPPTPKHVNQHHSKKHSGDQQNE